MSLENARVLYNTFLELKDKVHAEQILKSYPELEVPIVKEPEVKADGKKPKGRAKRAGDS